jgi:uncharacterized protein
MTTAVCLAQRLYDAFARFDAPALAALLSNDFIGTVSDGMPHGVGGTHYGPTDMLDNVWGTIARRYDLRVQPVEYLCVSETTVVVLGRYRGRAREGKHPSMPHSRISSPLATTTSPACIKSPTPGRGTFHRRPDRCRQRP